MAEQGLPHEKRRGRAGDPSSCVECQACDASVTPVRAFFAWGGDSASCDYSPTNLASVYVFTYMKCNSRRRRFVDVVQPPHIASSITRLSVLSWKHSIRDLKADILDQVCLITEKATDSIFSLEADNYALRTKSA